MKTSYQKTFTTLIRGIGFERAKHFMGMIARELKVEPWDADWETRVAPPMFEIQGRVNGKTTWIRVTEESA